MQMNTQTGPQVTPDGSLTGVARAGRLGDLITSELHGRYYEQTFRKNMFFAASQAVSTTTVGLATTYTGLVLSNPIGSGVNLVLNKASIAQSVIETATDSFGLAVGFNTSTNVTHTVPATPYSSLIGSGQNALGKVDTSATLPTDPVYYNFLQSTSSATTDVAGGIYDLEGSLILAPGAYALWASPAASVAGMWFGFSWEEVPVA